MYFRYVTDETDTHHSLEECTLEIQFICEDGDATRSNRIHNGLHFLQASLCSSRFATHWAQWVTRWYFWSEAALANGEAVREGVSWSLETNGMSKNICKGDVNRRLDASLGIWRTSDNIFGASGLVFLRT